MMYTSVKILIYFLIVYMQINGEIIYEAEFSEDFIGCKDFDNKYIICDSFKIGMVDGNEDGEGGIGLSGVLEMSKTVENGYMVSVEVWKLMDVGKEFTFASVTDVCKSLRNEEAPWYPLVLSMNVTECPIPAKTYPISDFIISLDFAKDWLCPEFCGEYEVILSVLSETEEQLSCYVLGISITEKETDDK